MPKNNHNFPDLSRQLPAHSMDEFLKTMVHESNNFLSPISGFAELSLMDEQLDPKIRSYFQEILTASNRNAEFNQQLLMFSGKLTPMIENISSIDMRLLLEKRNFDVDNDLTDTVYFQGNKNWLIRVVDCFRAFANDLKQQHLVISYTLQTNQFGCRCWFDTSRYDVNLAEFFQPFYSSRKLTKTKGLGLCWLPAFMQSMDGEIELNAAANGGIDLAILFKRTTPNKD